MHTDNLVLVVGGLLGQRRRDGRGAHHRGGRGGDRGLAPGAGGVAVAARRAWRALVAAIGPALVRYVPLSALRIVVGGVLLVFGLQWLRKAILRAAGVEAKHDEDAISPTERRGVARRPSARAAGRAQVAFKGAFLEGLEVVIIVLTLGTTDHRSSWRRTPPALPSSSSGRSGRGGGPPARRGVPENAMKMTVGIMLVSFGTFWSGEGVARPLARERRRHRGAGRALRHGRRRAGATPAGAACDRRSSRCLRPRRPAGPAPRRLVGGVRALLVGLPDRGHPRAHARRRRRGRGGRRAGRRSLPALAGRCRAAARGRAGARRLGPAGGAAVRGGPARAGGGIRTHDLTITNRLRFQLRHTGRVPAQATEAAGADRLHRTVTVGRLHPWTAAQLRAPGTPGAVAEAP